MFIINNLFSNRLVKFVVSFVANIQFSVHRIGSIDSIYNHFQFSNQNALFSLSAASQSVNNCNRMNERTRTTVCVPFFVGATIGGCSIATTAALDVACCMNFPANEIPNWTKRNARIECDPHFWLASRREF